MLVGVFPNSLLEYYLVVYLLNRSQNSVANPIHCSDELPNPLKKQTPALGVFSRLRVCLFLSIKKIAVYIVHITYQLSSTITHLSPPVAGLCTWCRQLSIADRRLSAHSRSFITERLDTDHQGMPAEACASQKERKYTGKGLLNTYNAQSEHRSL